MGDRHGLARHSLRTLFEAGVVGSLTDAQETWCHRNLVSVHFSRKLAQKLGVSSFFAEETWCQFIFRRKLGVGGNLVSVHFSGGNLVSVHFSGRKLGVSSFFGKETWCQFIFREETWCQFIFREGNLVSVHFSSQENELTPLSASQENELTPLSAIIDTIIRHYPFVPENELTPLSVTPLSVGK
jgi:hypothetical protein